MWKIDGLIIWQRKLNWLKRKSNYPSTQRRWRMTCLWHSCRGQCRFSFLEKWKKKVSLLKTNKAVRELFLGNSLNELRSFLKNICFYKILLSTQTLTVWVTIYWKNCNRVKINFKYFFQKEIHIDINLILYNYGKNLPNGKNNFLF